MDDGVAGALIARASRVGTKGSTRGPAASSETACDTPIAPHANRPMIPIRLASMRFMHVSIGEVDGGRFYTSARACLHRIANPLSTMTGYDFRHMRGAARLPTM